MGEIFRRVIRIVATDSPNVAAALEAQAKGLDPDAAGEVLPGVLSWEQYRLRRATWSPQRQAVGLDAQFWAGADELMFPAEWLQASEQVADVLEACGRAASSNPQYSAAFRPWMAAAGFQLPRWPRRAEGMGVDPAEGGDSSTWCVADRLGVIDLVTLKTPDTAVIPAHTLALMRQHGLPAERVCFDRGGGGKQHADVLRHRGHDVRTVAFGGSVDAPARRSGRTPPIERAEQGEERYVYVNMRAKLYGTLREFLDPTRPGGPWAVPGRFAELRRQLAPIPLQFDQEGRMILLPKSRRPGSSAKTLTDLIGRSPDDADACVLALHALTDVPRNVTVGGF